jgi:hypothetical protein
VVSYTVGHVPQGVVTYSFGWGGWSPSSQEVFHMRLHACTVQADQ